MLQSDPLEGRIREPLPERNLRHAMRWFLLAEPSAPELLPSQVNVSAEHHYLRVQARALTLLELWGIARGDDVRGDSDCELSVGKLYGRYCREAVVGPDPFYQLVLCKDESKTNKVGRNEMMGATRHKDPLLCAINAVASMLILRFGAGGIVGKLPDFFDRYCDWPAENSFLTTGDGTGILPYQGSRSKPGHVNLFADMKQAAGLVSLWWLV